MTYHHGPQDPDKRAIFEAALEMGVLPMCPANYTPLKAGEHRSMPVRKIPVPAKTVERKIVTDRPRARRKTRGLVVTAEDIMAGQGVV